VGLDAAAVTITTYFLFQAFAALIWGPISDSFGRRPTYIITLFILVIANIVLTMSPNITLVLVFRGVQGIASTVFIGSAVIYDIASDDERYDFLTFYQAIRNFIIVAAPFIGGLLSNYLNFRTIFIFLLSFSLAALVAVVFLLPETLRGIAGNGTIHMTGIYKPIINVLKVAKGSNMPENPNSVERPPTVSAKSFYEPLLLLKEKDIILSLTFGGITFAVWNMVAISTVGLFKIAFGLNPLFLGLALVANGKPFSIFISKNDGIY
jgi:MFS family permease